MYLSKIYLYYVINQYSYENFAIIISLILFLNTNAQIDNIAEKLGYEKMLDF